jgi:hypothetical protein
VSQAAGIVLWQPGAVNHRIINNIFYENRQYYPGKGGQGIIFMHDDDGHTVQNNIFMQLDLVELPLLDRLPDGKVSLQASVTKLRP